MRWRLVAAEWLEREGRLDIDRGELDDDAERVMRGQAALYYAGALRDEEHAFVELRSHVWMEDRAALAFLAERLADVPRALWRRVRGA